MRIFILSDPAIEPMPEYCADDVYGALASQNHELKFGDLKALKNLNRREVDLLILPYLNGEFPESCIEAMVRYHETGGGILVLGQLPHRQRWAPTRNFHGYRFHLTAYCGAGQVDGLSDFGKELLGDLPGLDQFSGKVLGCGRTTAFPPDESRSLFCSHNGQMEWESTPGVWIERRGRRFLGARFAQISCMGGEPREAAAGGFPMEWTHDPGLLRRDWPVMDLILQRLGTAMQPQSWVAALENQPLMEESQTEALNLLLRNFTASVIKVGPFEVRRGEEVQEVASQELSPGELRVIPLKTIPTSVGLSVWELWLERDCLHRVETRGLPARPASADLGFGFSTYWAFQTPEIPQEFLSFCKEMKRRGCRYIRVNLPWEDVEPAPGAYDWRIPDAYVHVATEMGLRLLFWVFPITRGATIGDGGVPAWVLKEPAITYDGHAGYFPTLWSPFYRSHYFGMIDALSCRYTRTDCLDRFIIDFGNSDFAYGYFYYVNDLTLFDYSPQECEAFAGYLLEYEGLTLDQISSIYGEVFCRKEDIPVPRATQHPMAWTRYLDFRAWSIREGLQEVHRILSKNAPDKVAPDLPGHGAGSIADLSSYHLASKAAHWQEEQAFPREITGLHNAGPTWGGEAWQVGARYKEYDDALFQSLRLGASYFTIPGPDIGVYGEDITKVGQIRGWMQGATRAYPKIAIMDRCNWNAFQSLAHVGARMDQPVDLLSARHRYDFSCYRLLVLPPNECGESSATGGGGGQLLPGDSKWAKLLRASIEKGLNVLLFPETARVEEERVPHTYVRQELGLMDVSYGERQPMALSYPDCFGGGLVSGQARRVQSDGEIVLCSEEGHPLLIRRDLGKGAVWLAGWDTEPDSIDGALSPQETKTIKGHSLCRLAKSLAILPPRIRSHQAYLYKEWICNEIGEYVLLFSHHEHPREVELQIRFDRPVKSMMDLANGEQFWLSPAEEGWQTLRIPCAPGVGRYLVGAAI